MILELRLGDNVTELRTMPDECIDLTVTSPPYDNLRNYGGHKWDFENLARELYRVTKRGGVVVWVVADETINGSETGTSFRQALFFMVCGFSLYDTMIFEKTNAAIPATVRYQDVFEYMFVLSKEKPKTINLISDIPNKQPGLEYKTKSIIHKGRAHYDGKTKIVKKYRVRGNIFPYAVGHGHDEIVGHPAQFPDALARDHILSWSNEGDMILDPFMGSGTTIKQAALLGRNAIGIEIHAPYVEVARKRVTRAQSAIDRSQGNSAPEKLSDTITQMDIFA